MYECFITICIRHLIWQSSVHTHLIHKMTGTLIPFFDRMTEMIEMEENAEYICLMIYLEWTKGAKDNASC